jgi:hypothetical protein
MKSNNEARARRQFSADAKWQILKEGRSTNLTISQVCVLLPKNWTRNWRFLLNT